jgi:DNA-binding IclR family transcriptional regulator
LAGDGRPYYQVATLGKGLDVLELVAERGPLSVSEAARRLGLNRASAHRFLATLRQWGYLRQGEDGLYGLSSKLLELGRRAVARPELTRLARPHLLELAGRFQETVNLGVWDHGEVLHIDKIDSPEILRTDQPVGGRAPAYATALGKALLAGLPPSELEAYLDGVELRALTPKTLTTPEVLRREIRRCRRRGWAVDNEELVAGLRCVGAAAADHRGRPVCALSLSAPSIRMTRARMQEMQAEVARAAASLSQALGAPADQHTIPARRQSS